MKNSIAFLTACLFFLYTSAQVDQYNLDRVPDSLKNKAAVVVFLDNTDLNVESPDKATIDIHQVYTVVNEEGKGYLDFQEFSNKYQILDYAEIKVYDKNGKAIGRYKKKDMVTHAIGEGLVEDGNVTEYEITTNNYPVTVELIYTIKLRSTLNLPAFSFIGSEQSVLESNYTARVPAEMDLRYKSRGVNLSPVIGQDGKYKTYKWSVKNLPAIPYEEGTAQAVYKYPHVDIAPTQFSYFGLQGDLSSWKSFGSWMNELYKNLDELPAERQAFFQDLVKDAPDTKEKIRRIYHYLQENFRYVSIQLGIGGLQPFSATFTDQKKYGDCKALSNFMKAALKSVGIRSYVGIINAEYNSEPVDPDFPENGFDHVILCVPLQKDSVWLECTSSTIDFATLGTFTENRNALLITDNGGVLVPTPKSCSSSNRLFSHTIITMDPSLSAKSETVFNSSGVFNETINSILKDKKDDQKEVVVLYFGYKQPDDFEITSSEPAKSKDVKLSLDLSKLPEFNAGNKYFIRPRINQMWTSKLPTAENRKMDFFFHFPFEKTDTTEIRLPSGYKLEVLPDEKEFKTKYTYYHTKSWYNKSTNSVCTATSVILTIHRIPAKDFAEVRSFFDHVVQDDSQRVVIDKIE